MKRENNKSQSLNYFLGIDPGKSGAWAVIDKDNYVVFAELWNESCLAAIANDHRNNTFFITSAVLELVHSMPKQGVKSMFTFGTNFGMWQGMLLSNQIPFDLIIPTRWMKMVLDSGNRTPEHRFQYALRHWPGAPLLGPRGAKRIGIADALCMAECARRMHLGKE